MAIAIVAFPLARRFLAPAIARDLRADIAWTNVDGPAAETTVAYRWYPLTYPVLERWALGDDDIRGRYAVKTLSHFGGPLARQWFANAIDRDPTVAYGWEVIPGPNDPLYAQFRSAMGLRTPADRARSASRAVRHIRTLTDDGEPFDDALLRYLGPDAFPAIDAWAKYAPRSELEMLDAILPYETAGYTEEQIAEIARLRRLMAAARKSDATPVVSAIPSDPHAVAIENAVVALNAGDRRGLPLLRQIVDGDLRRLDAVLWEPNLIAVANAFPNSRFTRGCLAYDALRGGSYYGRDDREDDAFPPGDADGWRRWLAAYPDHPGGDDAAYWLGRTLARDGRRADAAWAFANALEHRVGDGDMTWTIQGRLLFMLDVGTTEDELRLVERQHPNSLFTPIFRYARAVRRARANDFRGALALMGGSGFERTFDGTMFPRFERKKAITDYRDQLARWRRLAALVPNVRSASVETRDRLASAWNDDDGWTIGYLVLFGGDREGGATVSYDTSLDWAGIAPNARGANQNAQTIALAKPLADLSMPADVRERNQRRLVVAIYREITDFPDPETEMMGPLPALPSRRLFDESLFATERPTEHVPDDMRNAAADAWWMRAAIVEAERYANDYPNEPFAATALLVDFEASGHTAPLRTLIARYPDGPRTDEARALLWQATTPR